MLTEPMTQQELEEIRQAEQAATPGPWYGEENGGVFNDAEMGNAVFETGCGCCTSSTLTSANATFIALSRTAVPRLLAEVDRLTAALDAEKKRADKWKQAADDAGANTMFDPE